MFVRTVYEDHYQHIPKRAKDAEARAEAAEAKAASLTKVVEEIREKLSLADVYEPEGVISAIDAIVSACELRAALTSKETEAGNV